MDGILDGIFYVYGPEKFKMKQLLERYCEELHPEIKKVTETPLPVLRIIAFLTGNGPLKFAVRLFSYFEKVKEPEVPMKDLARLGKAEFDFETWIKSRK